MYAHTWKLAYTLHFHAHTLTSMICSHIAASHVLHPKMKWTCKLTHTHTYQMRKLQANADIRTNMYTCFIEYTEPCTSVNSYILAYYHVNVHARVHTCINTNTYIFQSSCPIIRKCVCIPLCITLHMHKYMPGSIHVYQATPMHTYMHIHKHIFA